MHLTILSETQDNPTLLSFIGSMGTSPVEWINL